MVAGELLSGYICGFVSGLPDLSDFPKKYRILDIFYLNDILLVD
jgi:hypothetical protein